MEGRPRIQGRKACPRKMWPLTVVGGAQTVVDQVADDVCPDGTMLGLGVVLGFWSGVIGF